MKTIRTRFAPSPTGFLHVGGLRTALYAYLLAKKHNGQFLLRIEDTDQSRSVPGAVENMIGNLAWAGIDFDEGPGKEGACGPYVQSERLPLYQKHAKQLVDAGHAYHCFCSSERLEKARAQQIAHKLPPAYDKHCRNLPKEEVEQKLQNKEPYVIRMKIPLEGDVTFNDVIRGDVSFSWRVIDDQVLLKSDGFPTYHLAVVVDDHYMNVSHTIRGEEWLSSTPKHILLYQYFGWEAPLFAHLPLLLNPDRSKLSKRQGDVAVDDYRNKGFLPEALVNFIAFLGWNPGDTREIFSLEDLKKEFSLERVGKSGAVFNIEKLNWLNQQYIQHMPADQLLLRVKPLLQEKGWTNHSDQYIKQVIELLRERMILLPDFITLGSYFFEQPTSYDEKAKAKSWKPEAAAHLKQLAQEFANDATFDHTSLENVLRAYAEKAAVGAGSLIHPLRLALTGTSQGPSLFHLMAVLGKEIICKRIEKACNILG